MEVNLSAIVMSVVNKQQKGKIDILLLEDNSAPSATEQAMRPVGSIWLVKNPAVGTTSYYVKTSSGLAKTPNLVAV